MLTHGAKKSESRSSESIISRVHIFHREVVGREEGEEGEGEGVKGGGRGGRCEGVKGGGRGRKGVTSLTTLTTFAINVIVPHSVLGGLTICAARL